MMRTQILDEHFYTSKYSQLMVQVSHGIRVYTPEQEPRNH